MTSIQLLGGAVLRRGDAPLTGPPVQRHRIALLALTAASWPRSVLRDRAQALLWPEHDAVGGRRLLNLAVHVLRRALGDGVIVSAGDGLLFDPAGVHCDLHAFRSAAAGGRPDAAVQAWGGGFLAGFHLSDAPEFDYWLEAERSDLAHTYEAMLLALAERQGSAGDVHGRVGTYRRLVAADPYSGGHACLLMRALDAAGDRAGALRHAADHARRMDADLGIEAAPEVRALAHALEQAASVMADGESTGAAPDNPRLVVVAAGPAEPGTDAEAGALNTDLRDLLIGHLMQVRNVRVSGGVGRALRVAAEGVLDRPRIDALVETTARRTEHGVRLRVRLVDAVHGIFLLARDFEAPSAAPAGLDALAEVAAEAVGRALTARPAAGPAGSDALDEAAVLCAKGQHFCAMREETALHRAIDCFDHARAIAPTFVPAYTGLARAYAVLGFYDLLRPRDAFTLARQAAQQALALNPADPDGHATLGYIAKYFDWNWRAAERELDTAIELDPANPLGHQWLGNYLVVRGRFDEAVASMNRAVRLAPHLAIATAAAGWAESHAGRHERALERLAEAAELDPRLPMAPLWRGQALIGLGRHEAAVDATREAVMLSPRSGAVHASHAYALAVAGASEDARDILRRLGERRRTDYVPSYEVAKVHIALGDHRRAIHWLGMAFRERSHSIGLLRVDPQLAPLRELPAFHRLLARVRHT